MFYLNLEEIFLDSHRRFIFDVPYFDNNYVDTNMVDYWNVRRYLMWNLDVNTKSQDGRTLLWHYCLNSDCVRILLEKGADPNIIDDNYISPLIVVVEYGKNDVAKMLLEANANPNTIDRCSMFNHITALDAAKCATNNELVELLKKFDAKSGMNFVDFKSVEIYPGCHCYE